MKKLIVTVIIMLSISTLYASNINLRLIKTETDIFPKIVTASQIYDESDEPIIGLKKSNFIVTIDGNVVDTNLTALTYKESGLGFNIMLCVDISGTMKGDPLDTVKKAVSKFIDEMRSVDKLAIMAYADDAELVCDFSNDKEFIKSQVNSLKAKGSQTALYYSAYKGLKKLVDIKDKTAKILILMGDGKNESKASSFNEDDIIELARKEGIPAFNIGYTNIDRSYLQSLERIADKTNGNFYESPDDAELDKQYAKLYRQLLNIYLISYEKCGLEGDGIEHINSITVMLNDNMRKSESNRFIAPAGVPSKKCDEEIIVSKGTNIWWFIIPIAIIILGAIGYFLWRKSESKKKNWESLKVKNYPIEGTMNHGIMSSPTPISIVGEEKPMVENDAFEKTTIYNLNAVSYNFSMEIKKGEYAGKTYQISSVGETIGRLESNTICLSKCAKVSKEHCKIKYESNEYFIEDLNSTNGTYINGKKISSCKINDNDTFKIGSNEGRFTISQGR